MNKKIIAAVLCLGVLGLTGCKKTEVDENGNEVTKAKKGEETTTVTTLPVAVSEHGFEETTTTTEATTTTVTTTETTTESTTTTPETTVETITTTEVTTEAPPRTVIVYRTVTAAATETTTVSTTAAPVVDIHKLVPDCDYNFTNTEPLGMVTIAGTEYNIRGLTLDEILEEGQFMSYIFDEENVGVDADVDTPRYFFEAPMYGYETIKVKGMTINDVFYETSLFSVETVDKNGDVVLNKDFTKIDEDDYNELYVKAIRSSMFCTQDNFDVTFYGGLKVGMTEEEFYEIMGKCYISKDRAIFKNKNNTLLVDFTWSIDDEGNNIRVVDEITLFNNDPES